MERGGQLSAHAKAREQDAQALANERAAHDATKRKAIAHAADLEERAAPVMERPRPVPEVEGREETPERKLKLAGELEGGKAA